MPEFFTTLDSLIPQFFAKLQVIWESLPYILGGVIVTVGTVVGALGLGFILGIPMAVGQIYGPVPVRLLVRLYVWFFRGTPLLVLLFLFYFGLFQFIGLDVSAFAASCLVLGLTSAAYQSQIFRASISALPMGQMKAARALGMSDGQALRNIILPQALRLSIPGWSNEFSILLKDSALAYALGAPEIMARVNFVATRTYTHLPLYIVAAILYFLITLAGLYFLRTLERKVRIPGYNIQ